ncbi:acyltransferase family protein [Dyadobacter helix]|uniref:acyltransferase family protein n=1 Tax=Dyadobacter helix TaxID=2822344 RepID=UPI001BFC325B|nr:acyltransferase [Dyadobacter sp. CECT 9275]
MEPENPVTSSKSGIIYLPGLNGFRAIAAVSVLVSHILQSEFSGPILNIGFRLPLGEFGVTLFFVISGFLITYLLLREREIGEISISWFYFRRVLRIWPLYYSYIFIWLIVWMFQGDNKFGFSRSIYWYIFFSANIPFIFHQSILVIGHLWSIGVEEQFYIFWPWVVKFSRNKLFVYSWFFFLSFFILKILFWYFLGKESFSYRALSVTRFHCLVVGAIGAFHYNGFLVIVVSWISNRITQIAAWSLFFLIGLGFIRISAPIAHEFFAFISLVLIIGQITARNRIINLENSVFNFIGKISYGIYVIHPLIILLITPLLKGVKMGNVFLWSLIYCLGISIVTIVLAYLSFRYLERPFLIYKLRFSKVLSSNVNGTNNDVLLRNGFTR